jgi:hypothetical protein
VTKTLIAAAVGALLVLSPMAAAHASPAFCSNYDQPDGDYSPGTMYKTACADGVTDTTRQQYHNPPQPVIRGGVSGVAGQ